MLRSAVVMAILLTITSLPQPARADRLPWVGLWQESHHHEMEDPDSVSLSAVTDPVPLIRGLPFGFNRGTCDRDHAAAEERLAPPQTDTGMDKNDQGCLAAAFAWLPNGSAVAWGGEDGARYRVSTQQSWLSEGRPCRAYRAVSQAGGRLRQFAGSACQQPDGRWALSD